MFQHLGSDLCMRRVPVIRQLHDGRFICRFILFFGHISIVSDLGEEEKDVETTIRSASSSASKATIGRYNKIQGNVYLLAREVG